MKLSQVQSAVAASLESSAVLAAFGPVLKVSLATSDEDAVKTVNDALEAKGVLIEVGAVEAEPTGDESVNIQTMDVQLSVFVAESPTVSHTPSEIDLVQACIDQSLRPLARGVFPKFRGLQAAVNDRGQILHIIDLSVRIDNRST